MNTRSIHSLVLLIGGLCLGAGFYWIHRSNPLSMPTAPLLNTPSTATSNTVTVPVVSGALPIPTRPTHDPFQSPLDSLERKEKTKAVVRPEDRVHLEGIIMNLSSKKRRAIVNGRVVAQGSVINGVTIKSIKRHKVTYDYKGKSFTQSVAKRTH